jgi:hypothetical protein
MRFFRLLYCETAAAERLFCEKMAHCTILERAKALKNRLKMVSLPVGQPAAGFNYAS